MTAIYSIAPANSTQFQKSNEDLYAVQEFLVNMTMGLWPDGNWDSNLNMAIGMASNDLCKINNKRQQKEDSVMVGQKCKNSFSAVCNLLRF